MFSWNSLAFSMIQGMLAIWSPVPLPFLNPACTTGSSQFKYYWSLAWRILSITFLACEMSTTVEQSEHFWHFPSLGLEWKLTFSSPVATAEFSKFAHILSAAPYTALSLRILSSSAGVQSPPLAFLYRILERQGQGLNLIKWIIFTA